MSPPALLVKSLRTRPDAADITGVRRGAIMSSASWRRPPARNALKLLLSFIGSTPVSGIANSALNSCRSADVALGDGILGADEDSAVVTSAESPSAVRLSVA